MERFSLRRLFFCVLRPERKGGAGKWLAHFEIGNAESGEDEEILRGPARLFAGFALSSKR